MLFSCAGLHLRNGLVTLLVTGLFVMESPAQEQSASSETQPELAGVSELLSGNPACDPESIQTLAEAGRRGIEREVWRREDAFRPPSPASELSCLGDLMRNTSPLLDVAFPTGQLTSGLPGFVQGILSQLLGDAGGATDFLELANSGDPTRTLSSALCDFAAQRWNRPTVPSFTDFTAGNRFAQLPGDPVINLLAPAILQSITDPSAASTGGTVSPDRILGISQ
ncbi:MAG: hypothetical protein OXE84_04815 [Rhodobacteraceae bacterium]|nr:hypothetical protein [Paracoccaceae bacterium]MCY4196588.1 hypothetical protein [Paracoccaceae bacterium]